MNSLPTIAYLLLISHLLASPAFGQIMEKESYMLRLESFSDKPTPTPTPPEKTIENNYPTTNPIPVYPANAESLNLSVFPGVVDFGIVHSTTPIDRNTKASSTILSDFYLYTYVTGQLRSEENEIPQTSCDNGSCSEHVAGDWNSTLSFGLGYSCSSDGCDRDFENDRYRPFSLTPTAFAEPVENENSLKEVLIPLRLNTSNTQSPGNYENNIIILAVPKL